MTELELKYLGADIRKLTAAIESLTAALTASRSPSPSPSQAASVIETRIKQVSARPRAGRKGLSVNDNSD
ncbi:hypothetical protein [Streptomyces violarus]|uniref:Uncharacterized protein n=1 Tax=Streptomyces violarus TaxID=67380 RepID=A0A7W4ZN75_9ACTN|nr:MULTISPECIES: hypothetical protein [Streptomyces]MBB3075583.1 hypothetical protein [Streptomyces violarus]WRT98173.1 hypothetical protein VJ737_10965 [Streptomyces sp. CGMCC 4.1772]